MQHFTDNRCRIYRILSCAFIREILSLPCHMSRVAKRAVPRRTAHITVPFTSVTAPLSIAPATSIVIATDPTAAMTFTLFIVSSDVSQTKKRHIATIHAGAIRRRAIVLISTVLFILYFRFYVKFPFLDYAR